MSISEQELREGFDSGKFSVPHWPEFNEFMELMKIEKVGGTERGLVLVCSSMIEELSGRLLKSYLKDCAATDDLMKPDHALGVFSNRIKLLYALGAIDDAQMKAMDQLRKIRNDFAHRLDASFKVQAINDRRRNFVQLAHREVSYPGSLPDDRGNFMCACAILGMNLAQKSIRRDPVLMTQITEILVAESLGQ